MRALNAMLNEYLLIPGFFLLLLIPLGYLSLLASFTEEMGDKLEGTLWSRVGKFVWLPRTDGGSGLGLAIGLFYILVTLPVLTVCCLTGYFAKRIPEPGIKIMSIIVGALGVMFFASILLWLYKSI